MKFTEKLKFLKYFLKIPLLLQVKIQIHLFSFAKNLMFYHYLNVYMRLFSNPQKHCAQFQKLYNKSSLKLSIFGAYRIFQSIESYIYSMSNEIIQINNAVVECFVLLYVCDMVDGVSCKCVAILCISFASLLQQ